MDRTPEGSIEGAGQRITRGSVTREIGLKDLSCSRSGYDDWQPQRRIEVADEGNLEVPREASNNAERELLWAIEQRRTKVSVRVAVVECTNHEILIAVGNRPRGGGARTTRILERGVRVRDLGVQAREPLTQVVFLIGEFHLHRVVFRDPGGNQESHRGRSRVQSSKGAASRRARSTSAQVTLGV